MVSIEDAVKAAHDFAKRLYDSGELKDLRVEEIEHSEDKWVVTLGWVEPAVREVGGFAGLTNVATLEPLPRVYKVFTVDKDGQVESMKMRD